MTIKHTLDNFAVKKVFKSIAILLVLLVASFSDLQASTYLDSLKGELGKKKSNEDKYELYCAVGSIYAHANMLCCTTLANCYFDSAYAMAIRTNSPVKQLHLELIRVYLLSRDNARDIENKRKTILALIGEAKKLHAIEEEAYGKLQLAYLYITTDSPSAQSEVNSTMDIYRVLGDSFGIAKCNSILAELFSRRGYKNDALILAEKAYRYYDRNISSCYFLQNKMFSLNQLAELAFRRNEKQLAKEYLNKSLELSFKLDSITYLPSLYFALSDIYKSNNQFDSSKLVLNKLLLVINKYQAKELLPGYYFHLAEINLLDGKKYIAIQNIKQSFLYTDYIRSKYDKCCAYVGVANFYSGIGDFDRCISAVLLALPIAKEDGRRALLMDTYNLLYSNYKHKGDYKRAFLYLEKYDSIQSDQVVIEKAQQITKLQLQNDLQQKEKQSVVNQLRQRAERLAEREKGRLTLFLFAGCIFLLIFGIMFLSIQKLRAKSVFEMALSEQNKFLAISVLAAQEEERKKIAQDIHDGLGAYLSSLRINLSIIKNDIPDTSLYIAQNMTHAVNKISTEIKNIADFLVSDTLHKYGLVIAIEELVEMINSSNRVKITFKSEGNFNKVSKSVQLCLFRIVQELFTNMMKHSHASNCSLAIFCNDEIVVNYFDDGIGLHLEKRLSSEGKGFKNMQSRIKIHGGAFTILSSSDDSLAILIEIPDNV